MRPSRFSDEEIMSALRLVRSGTPAVQVCRDLKITQTTFYRWRARYEAPADGTPEELHALRDENNKLKQIVSELLLQGRGIPGTLR